MTHPPANPASEVASKLTMTLQVAVVSIGDPKLPFGGMWRTGLTTQEELWLKDRGIVHWSIPAGTSAPMCSLTPLGRQVRAHLLTQATGDTK